MLAKVLTGTAVGLECSVVEVEVDLAQGLPSFTIVGLPDTAVQEARERVRAAVRNSGFPFPLKRVTVNLAPAEVRKEGAGFDVPIAIGVLAATGMVALPEEPTLFLGELSLDGSLRHTTGILPLAALARERHIGAVVVPVANAAEAALVDGVQVVPVSTLAQLAAHLVGEQEIEPYERGEFPDCPAGAAQTGELAAVQGQEHAKRALEVAAAGGHSLLMVGSPGTGKTLLARCLPSILPPMTLDEALEVSKIYSICGLLPPEAPLLRQRPFRAPHHTISHAGLVGGGSSPRPGELSLAHRGVLFLDELPEFGQYTLDTLRQPLEDGVITISRATGAVTFPAKVTLAGAMNPCPCIRKRHSRRFPRWERTAAAGTCGHRAPAGGPGPAGRCAPENAPLPQPLARSRQAAAGVPRALRADAGRGRTLRRGQRGDHRRPVGERRQRPRRHPAGARGGAAGRETVVGAARGGAGRRGIAGVVGPRRPLVPPRVARA
jgi:magnesium chelatase family protein